VAQVADGPGWSGMSLPVRAHDLLLTFAGRVDDDALADARELLASAEVDRALDFLVGCLVAGHIPVSSAQRDELENLSAQAYLDRSLFGRLAVDDTAPLDHRFGGDQSGGESAAQGVAEAAHRVLDVLPDVRSVWAVWRLTPAGAVSGPVPHRVVLVGVGPGGFPTATAYRLEHALRRVGIRASVEALRDGAPAPDYHHSAMQYATQVPFNTHAAIAAAPVRAPAQLSASRLPAVPDGSQPRLGPSSATRMPPVTANPPSVPRLEPPSVSRMPPAQQSGPPSRTRMPAAPPGPPSRTRMPAAGSPSAPRLEPPSRTRMPAAPPGPPSRTRMPAAGSPSAPRLEPPSRTRMPAAGSPSVPRLEPPSLSRTAPVPPQPNGLRMPQPPPGPPSQTRMPPGPPSRTRMPAAGAPSVPRLEPPSLSRTPPAPPPGPPSMSRMPPAPPRGRHDVPADPLASAHPPRPANPPRRAEPPYPQPARAAGTASGLPPLPNDAGLSEQEKYLLRQLQEELVRREREEAGNAARQPGRPPGPGWSDSGGQTMVNGIPPQYPDYRR
jgi:hypothetical protein